MNRALNYLKKDRKFPRLTPQSAMCFPAGAEPCGASTET